LILVLPSEVSPPEHPRKLTVFVSCQHAKGPYA